LGASDLVAIRAGIGGLLLLPVFVFRARSLSRSAFVDGLWLTVGSGAPFALIVSAGLRYAPASHAAALTPGTMPLWAALLGLVFLKDRLSRVQLLGLVLIASGALVLAGGLAGRHGGGCRAAVIMTLMRGADGRAGGSEPQDNEHCPKAAWDAADMRKHGKNPGT
jgi:drug/metabolite transporter (DMT)-like permease